MLRNVSEINGYAIAASDGRLGTVSDLLFDDATWLVRWLVVDTGGWLSGRKVLLPPSVLGHLDTERHEFSVRLTKQQVKDSPDIDADRPVSRQAEANVARYYSWAPYPVGTDMPLANTMATPFVEPLFLSPMGPSADAEPDVPGDPHLRSVAAVTGYHIHATDGEIGHVENFLVDEADWSIRYLTIDTRNWWPGEKVLISPRSVTELGWAERSMHVGIRRQKMKDGPRYDPATTLDGAYDEAFLTYYGIKWVEA
jgi:hypothetical protein